MVEQADVFKSTLLSSIVSVAMKGPAANHPFEVSFQGLDAKKHAMIQDVMMMGSAVYVVLTDT